MSEKKYEEKVLEKLSQIVEQTKPLKDKESSEPSTDAHKTHEGIEDLLNCPDCYPPIKKAVLEKEFKDKKLVKCQGCGLPVRQEEEKCSNCGETEADSY